MNSLLRQSCKVKEQANRILKESKIIEILKKYGEVTIHGSYALDVMWKPDVDVLVVVKKHNWKKLMKISEIIMTSKYFRKFVFSNAIDFEGHNGIPCKGYFLQGWKLLGKTMWKVDIWIITPSQFKLFHATNSFKKLLDKEKNDQKRTLILKIKKALLYGMKYSNDVEGRLIYESVLEKNIKSIQDFNKFIKTVKK